MSVSPQCTEQLDEIRSLIEQLVQLENNPFDTSSFDREKLRQLQDLLVALQRLHSSGSGGNATPASSASISASVGDKGTNNEADVRTVQTLLGAKGHRVGIDGLIGPQTIGAIHAFQRGLFQGWSDGLIEPGRNTWKALSDAADTTGDDTTPDDPPVDDTTGSGGGTTQGQLTASVGRGGVNNEADVRHIQELLNRVGAQLTVDGRIGRNTNNAIELIQMRLEISPDGLIEPGRNTYRALLAGNVPESPQPSGRYFTHPRAGSVRISYGGNAVHLNAAAKHLLQSVLAASGNRSATVTSSYRSYYHQARVMIEGYSIARMQGLYSRGAEFARLRRQARENIDEFARLLRQADQQSGRLVSLHVTGYAIDVSPHQNRSAYAAKMQQLKGQSGTGISRFIPKGMYGENVDHVEFTFRVV